MSQLLHVSSAAVKETEDGNVSTITLGAVSANAAELIPLVGEQVILRTPGQQGRSFGGSLSALLVKDTKNGPEVTVKVVGGTILNGLVGTNVEIEAAQMGLYVNEPVKKEHAAAAAGGPPPVDFSESVALLNRTMAKQAAMQESPVKAIIEPMRKENAELSEKLKPAAVPDLDDLENF